MGCASSTRLRTVAVEKPERFHLPQGTTWSQQRTPSQAKSLYVQEGTLHPKCSSDQLIFRALLDNSHAVDCMRPFFTSFGLAPALDCMLDLLRCKKMHPDMSLCVKVLSIYDRHVKGGGAFVKASLSAADRATLEKIIPPLRRYVRSNRDCAPESAPSADGPSSSVDLLMVSLGSTHADMFRELQGLFDNMLTNTFAILFRAGYCKFSASRAWGDMIVALRARINAVTATDFEYQKIVGKGGFGVVIHVVKKSTGRHYAMKVQEKLKLASNASTEPWRIDAERRALIACRHPFIVDLSFAFQTKTMVMLVMSLASAGDLSSQMRRHPKHRLSVDHARFYAAEVVCALLYMHCRGLIFRDLKASNVLLDAEGHVQLTDFGAIIDVSGGNTLSSSTPQLDGMPLFSAMSEEVGHVQFSDYAVLPRCTLQSNLSLGEMQQGSGGVTAPSSDVVSLRKGYSATADGSVNGSLPASEPDSMENSLPCDGLRQVVGSPHRSLLYRRPLRRAVSVVGTFGYMAPEVMRMMFQRDHGGYTSAVDWWSLGVMLYKMLAGSTPFPATNFSNVRNPRVAAKAYLSYQQLLNPPNCSVIEDDVAVSAIENLLRVDEYERMCGSDVCVHPFFRSVDWARLAVKEVAAPPLPLSTESCSTPAPGATIGARSNSDLAADFGAALRAQTQLKQLSSSSSLHSFQDASKEQGFASVEAAVCVAGKSHWLFESDEVCNAGSLDDDPYWEMAARDHLEQWAFASPAAVALE